MFLQQILERHWQKPYGVLSVLLLPLAYLFAGVVAWRRWCFLSGCLKINRLSVPVVVVGNIHVGGTGKTPITLALVKALQEKGIKVGVISRGYGRKDGAVRVLHAESVASEVGDEPLLLYRKTGVPLAVGKNRYQAGLALLARFPDVQVVVADDGLQHYALARDLEIGVFPAVDLERVLYLLPQGNLREPLSRLQEVDAVVLSAGDEKAVMSASSVLGLPKKVACFYSELHQAMPYRLNCPEDVWSWQTRENVRCVAMAGIARPERFFEGLQQLGIDLLACYVLPDHATIDVAKLPEVDYIFITEKDAVKLSGKVPDNIWVLPVCAVVSPDLADFVIRRCRLVSKEG